MDAGAIRVMRKLYSFVRCRRISVYSNVRQGAGFFSSAQASDLDIFHAASFRELAYFTRVP